jgi:hypothetical protein
MYIPVADKVTYPSFGEGAVVFFELNDDVLGDGPRGVVVSD